ncbi:MAG: anthranilate phosphoribosyltransferase [Flavobacteriales bacterium CG_4_9_14_0_2_um_filter_35_242]|nr:anthranilate phosphoribosyltransferase [Zetaproteobacteria bacterium]NDK18348.1 anthranilate phosphoribosyltransferase [Flavobacteriales bacterium]OIO10733.1 MAG: anthranilate phosphoribosyltransferase [Flavobacteriaceae bacterium CG1_02_35_72]PIV16840.1 MAG: anthranilate phosphoribosyltransferase [Flavobacteriales bacterium CG03_land_8_20_14_0_80_35_15]PJA05275.1 MAG: anthranilate phosphoribosyltransferase [Flavobacteriales bacterium CG_4_10_14_0_2_um_filter_35_18]PJC59852.1 MAG: anthranil
MKSILNRLINQEKLTNQEAKQSLINISNGLYNESQIASFLTIYMMRSVSIQELSGFRDALLELCLPIDLSDFNTVDLCGTGGDGKNTFNISTLASFVVAGAGVKVTKHGNYGVSSVCGSSNVLEYLGIKFTNDLSKLKRTLDQAGICILHAPLFHPAMKHVAPIRKALGVKTFFNMLGPLVNPARPKNQMVGVFNLELARLYGYLFQESAKNYAILHDLAGYDEISLTNTTKVITNHQDAMITAQSLKVNSVTEAAIFGGVSIQEAAHIFVSILEGRGTEAQNNVVCANAGLAISIVNNLTHLEGFELAKISLKEKKALKSFKKLQTLSC